MCIGETVAGLEVEGGVIEAVEDFCYLGSTVTDKHGIAAEITKRVSKARAAFSRLWSKVWGVNQLSRTPN